MSNFAPHQQRVVEEKAELDAKISRLEAFLNDNTNVLSLPVDALLGALALACAWDTARGWLV